MSDLNTYRNSSTEYRIRIMSTLAMFIAFLSIMIILLGIMAIALGVAVFGHFALPGIAASVVVGLAAAFFLIRLLLTNILAQKIVVTLLKDGMDIRYISRPFFDRVKNCYVHVSDIRSYQVYTHPGPRLTMKLHSGAKLKFAAPNIGDNSQLALLVEGFDKMVEQREKTEGPVNPIERKKTIYEGTSGIVLAVFFVVVSLLMLYAILFMPNAHETKDVVFALGAMCTGLGYVFHILSVRKKKTQQKDQ